MLTKQIENALTSDSEIILRAGIYVGYLIITPTLLLAGVLGYPPFRLVRQKSLNVHYRKLNFLQYIFSCVVRGLCEHARVLGCACVGEGR